jgi:hypothetical protein
MATVMDYAKCSQCAFEFGSYEFNCRTNEEEFLCRRCGHAESVEWITDEGRNRIGWRRETFDGHGAMWVTRTAHGISTFHGLRSAQEVKDAAEKMQDSIARGELNAESSYVTRWDADEKSVAVVAGKWVEFGEEDRQQNSEQARSGQGDSDVAVQPA